ncbi:hypothetical protein ACFGZ0_08110 [Pasteurella multocida]|nr:hypothetical protein [Pasteurella multocida]
MANPISFFLITYIIFAFMGNILFHYKAEGKNRQLKATIMILLALVSYVICWGLFLYALRILISIFFG